MEHRPSELQSALWAVSDTTESGSQALEATCRVVCHESCGDRRPPVIFRYNSLAPAHRLGTNSNDGTSVQKYDCLKTSRPGSSRMIQPYPFTARFRKRLDRQQVLCNIPAKPHCLHRKSRLTLSSYRPRATSIGRQSPVDGKSFSIEARRRITAYRYSIHALENELHGASTLIRSSFYCETDLTQCLLNLKLGTVKRSEVDSKLTKLQARQHMGRNNLHSLGKGAIRTKKLASSRQLPPRLRLLGFSALLHHFRIPPHRHLIGIILHILHDLRDLPHRTTVSANVPNTTMFTAQRKAPRGLRPP